MGFNYTLCQTGVRKPFKEKGNFGEFKPAAKNCKLLIFDLPRGSTDQRFRLLPNYFSRMYELLTRKQKKDVI